MSPEQGSFQSLSVNGYYDLHYFILLRNRDLRCEGLEWKTLETEVAIDFWA